MSPVHRESRQTRFLLPPRQGPPTGSTQMENTTSPQGCNQYITQPQRLNATGNHHISIWYERCWPTDNKIIISSQSNEISKYVIHTYQDNITNLIICISINYVVILLLYFTSVSQVCQLATYLKDIIHSLLIGEFHNDTSIRPLDDYNYNLQHLNSI